MLHCYVDTNQLTDYYYDMAYDGKWQEGLQFMDDAYQKVSSVRDGIESERNLQGFFMAYLNLNDYYITASELELNHGFVISSCCQTTRIMPVGTVIYLN